MFQSNNIYIFLFVILFFGCADDVSNKTTSKSPEILFSSIPASHSKVEFTNTIKETNSFNFMSYSYIYLGAGVATGDINNDGLVDLYFGSNQNNNKLFLNQGDFVFKDISASAKITSSAGWTTGVNMMDFNNDGWLDIYVCKSGPIDKDNIRKNKLYINQKDNTFLEKGQEWGVSDGGYSIQSYYFDYDKDGDLDMYVVNHRPDFSQNMKISSQIQRAVSAETSDQLYRNDGNHFTNISQQSGIQNKAWGLSASIGDFNNDGWPDIYICNDFLEPDILYINQKDGTFKDEILNRMRHITFNSMGSDFADINNDGYLDLCALDMTPSDHVRSKENMASMNTKGFNTMVSVGYHHQYMINGLQLNKGNGRFSDIGQMAGIAKTDWSWTPLIADFDNDGFNDIYITNGIIKDISNRDFRIMLSEKNKKGESMQLSNLIDIMPEKRISNYLFHNNQDLTFSNKAKEWGLAKPSFSNGAAYADLDNDGDLDLITNNAKDNAFIYQNNSVNNSIQIKLIGPPSNTFGIGSTISIRIGDKTQTKELYLSRGFQSSVSTILHFGVQDNQIIDEIKVVWPDGKVSTQSKVKANQLIKVTYKNAKNVPNETKLNKTLVQRINSSAIGLDFTHQENAFNDFHKQVLLPHSQSKNGPFISQADVNGDSLIDLFIGGSMGQSGQLFIQGVGNKFHKSTGPWRVDAQFEDLGSLFFDYDGDGDQDLYIVSGGTERNIGSSFYQDRLYKNDGKGHFSKTVGILPEIAISGQSVCTSDVDGDGDLDLFLGGRIIPNQYPYSPKSILLINENGKFKDMTATLAPDLANPSMISEAIFSDYDGDGDKDLLAVGEWSKIMIFENNNGTFNRKEIPGLKDTRGLWFSIKAHDIDDDGDLDYFVGNLGLNAKFHTTKEKEFHIFCSDFDQTGTYDIVLSNKYKGALVPIRGKQCSSDQMPDISNKFPTYKQFAAAGISDMFTDKQLAAALHYQADLLQNVYLENLGNGDFTIHALPFEAQVGPILDFDFIDLNNDQKEEIICIGNMYNSEVETQRYDASYGVVLSIKNNNFSTISSSQTGFYTSGDSKDIAIIPVSEDKLLVVTNNNGKLDIYKPSSK